MSNDARNGLVREHLALVGYLVNEVANRATHMDRDDLASAGALGLLMAAQSYDPARGVPFGAFARRRILGAIADEMRGGDWATRAVRQRIKDSLRVQESLIGALGRAPSLDEIAEALGVDRRTAADALADASRTVSTLDETMADVLAAEAASPEDLLLETERSRYLAAAVEALPERMRYIVEQIYYRDRGVQEVAEELGLTHSAVSQQRAEAVRLMRDGLESQYLEAPQPEPHSRVAPARRASYLARLAETASTAARTAVPAGGRSVAAS